MSETPATYSAPQAHEPIRAQFCVEHGAVLFLHDRIVGQNRYTCQQCPAEVLWWVDGTMLTKFHRSEEKK